MRLPTLARKRRRETHCTRLGLRGLEDYAVKDCRQKLLFEPILTTTIRDVVADLRISIKLRHVNQNAPDFCESTRTDHKTAAALQRNILQPLLVYIDQPIQ